MASLIIPLAVTLGQVNLVFDIILGGAGIVALIYGLWRRSVKAANGLEDMKELTNLLGPIKELVDHELNHNSGSSVKDKAYKAVEEAELARREASRAADAAETTAQGVQSMPGDLRTFMVSVMDEHRALWRAVDGLKHDNDHN
jgi:hypothetical protein